MSRKYAILILAAGTSSRLERPKQLVKFGNDTLLSNTIGAALLIENADTHIILGAYADEISDAINTTLPIHINPNWERGMGNSIAFGIGRIRDLGYDAVILTVCDQPFMNAVHFKQLIELYKDNSTIDLVISKYKNGNGPPSLFDAQFFNQLLMLDGDDGAKTIVKNNMEKIGFVDFDRGDIDVDTEEDLLLL